MKRTIFQHCDTCKDETVFNYEDMVCSKCGKKSKNYLDKPLHKSKNSTTFVKN